MNTNLPPESAVAALRTLSLPDVATVEDLARHLKLSSATVRAHLRAGRLPGRRVGRRWYVPRQALLSLLVERRAAKSAR
jgi:excisionase family DNA binding protein